MRRRPAWSCWRSQCAKRERPLVRCRRWGDVALVARSGIAWSRVSPRGRGWYSSVFGDARVDAIECLVADHAAARLVVVLAVEDEAADCPLAALVVAVEQVDCQHLAGGGSLVEAFAEGVVGVAYRFLSEAGQRSGARVNGFKGHALSSWSR